MDLLIHAWNLIIPPLKLGYEWVITSQIKQWMVSSIHVLIWIKGSLQRRVSQMLAILVVCRELAMDYNTLPKVLYVFEHKTYYIFFHAIYNRITAFR